MKKTPLFNIGDRVKALHQTAAMTHGVVVYDRGMHNPKNPRVRFATGWGVSCKPGDLVALTPEEIESLPVPETIRRDFMNEDKIIAEAYVQLGMPPLPPIAG